MQSISPGLASPQGANVFKPSRRRYLVYRTLVTCAAYQFCFVCINTFSRDLAAMFPPDTWLVHSLAFLIASAGYMAFRTRSLPEELAIRVDGGMIEGPGLRRGRRVRFAIERLDLERCAHPGLVERVLQVRRLWSVDGEGILLLAHAFAPHDLDALFKSVMRNA